MSTIVHLPRRYAFVLPRFGEGIAGGAETLAGALAQHLDARGDEIEILTTCARDNRTWANEYAPGHSHDCGLFVRRFPVDVRNLDRWVPLQIRVSEGMQLTPDEEIDWMENGVNSLALYEHLALHAREFSAVFYAPYLFGTTVFGSLVHPQNAVLIPCLHDEYYAHTGIVRAMFSRVRGAIFNAEPERDLAEGLFGPMRGGVVGMGFDSIEPREDTSPYFGESFPYLLYLGRKETGKNVQLLVDFFIAQKDAGHLPQDFRLVILGGGSFDDLFRPAALARGDILDLPHVSESEKLRVISHAFCLVQPSVNESFSIVLMEAWRLGVPVLVHAGCAVTRHHVVRANGGLYFADEHEFGAVVDYMVQQPHARRMMGVQGQRYVAQNYSWPVVLDRFDCAMREISFEQEAASAP